jgi:hypothetical protein
MLNSIIHANVCHPDFIQTFDECDVNDVAGDFKFTDLVPLSNVHGFLVRGVFFKRLCVPVRGGGVQTTIFVIGYRLPAATIDLPLG